MEVIAPDPTLVVQAAALYLEYVDPLPADLQVVRRGLDRGAIDAIRHGISDAAVSVLAAEARRFLDVHPTARGATAADLYRRLVALTENRVIGLLSDVLAIVHRKHRRQENRPVEHQSTRTPAARAFSTR